MRKFNITKEELIDLYEVKRLTAKQIAELKGSNKKSVLRQLKRYEIVANHAQRKFEDIKKVPLTDFQKEFLFGTLLGDGCIGKHGRINKAYRFFIGHCEKQVEYLRWKHKIIEGLSSKILKRIDKRGNSIMYNFHTLTHPDLEFFEKFFYINRVKIVRPELEQYLTPFSLAVWFCDDGSCYRKKGKFSLATDGFSLEDHLILKNIFKNKFNIDCKICTYIRRKKTYYTTGFNRENSKKLDALIRPFVIESMQYKLIPANLL